jgi:hypothetical protein
MATSVQVSASGQTITVMITGGPGYNPGGASVQVTNNTTGMVLPTPVPSMMGSTATFTFNSVPAGGYTVTVTCGGETTVSTVNSVQAAVSILAPPPPPPPPGGGGRGGAGPGAAALAAALAALASAGIAVASAASAAQE